ncbi:ATP-grasp domain-containing protein [Brevibacterium pigmentatum]|uniref:ATP-grasp domain-containing protein n=1 Tax=Brevibacterium pigmentatum TaxID=1496080 RepID=UPI001423DDD1|nr:ATP-grasp domain-containing protein [Brevibacterium pigmentatum]
MTSIPATVVIGSAGRRLYLIDWFRKAFETLGVEGRVVVTENDETSSSATYGDIGRIMPKYSDPAYETALLDLIVDLEPQLFISVNDYELLHLHVNTDLADRMRQLGVLVPGVSAEWQRGCVDKLRMAQMLTAIGVRTAPTVTGGDGAGLSALAAYTDDVVVKHRFGSGSSGLAIVSAARAEEAVAESLLSAPAQSGGEPTADDVVIQPKLSGTEHGVDIVGALHAPGDLAAVLARRKLRMRAGETDKAVTVDPAPFVANSALIAKAAGLTGLIDVDMFLDGEGRSTVIDINPRFGGGYPFVHLAGADVPLYYLAQAMGRDDGFEWSRYEPGVVSAKYESIRVAGRVPVTPTSSVE